MIPERCEREGCFSAVETYCPLCEGFYCLEHDVLPDGHRLPE